MLSSANLIARRSRSSSAFFWTFGSGCDNGGPTVCSPAGIRLQDEMLSAWITRTSDDRVVCTNAFISITVRDDSSVQYIAPLTTSPPTKVMSHSELTGKRVYRGCDDDGGDDDDEEELLVVVAAVVLEAATPLFKRPDSLPLLVDDMLESQDYRN
jgi:hypothetical protein